MRTYHKILNEAAVDEIKRKNEFSDLYAGRGKRKTGKRPLSPIARWRQIWN